jgi:hypothetical protein
MENPTQSARRTVLSTVLLVAILGSRTEGADLDLPLSTKNAMAAVRARLDQPLQVDPVPPVPKGVDPMREVPLDEINDALGDLTGVGAAEVWLVKGFLNEKRGQLAAAIQDYAQVNRQPPTLPREFKATTVAYARIVAIHASGLLSSDQLRSILVPLPQNAVFLPHPTSRTQVAELLFEGRGVEKDPAKALDWFLRAAQADGVEAMMRLAELWRSGLEGQAADPAESVRWLRRAARLGHAPAQLELGRAYLSGSGVTANRRLAAKWFHTAAAGGSTEAAALASTAEKCLSESEKAAAKAAAQRLRTVQGARANNP